FGSSRRLAGFSISSICLSRRWSSWRSASLPGRVYERRSIDLQVAVLERDLAVLELVEVDAVAVERLALGVNAGNAEGAEQGGPGAMDARLRVARLAMGLALVGEVAPESVLALEHRAGGPRAGSETPFEVVGHAGRDLLDVGLVESLAEAAEQIVDGVGHARVLLSILPRRRAELRA